MINVGVIGYGYWRPQTSCAILHGGGLDAGRKRFAHMNPAALARVRNNVSRRQDVHGSRQILKNSPTIDAVAVYHSRVDALRIGKESTLEREARVCREAVASNSAQAEELIGTGRAREILPSWSITRSFSRAPCGRFAN